MKVQRPILIIAIIVLFVSLACTILGSARQTATPTETKRPPVATKLKQPTKAAPTQIPTSSAGPYFTEEFKTNPHWELAVIPDKTRSGQDPSDPESVTTSFSSSRMIFNIPQSWLSAFYIYTGETYDDVRLDIEFNNRGANSQQISLVCRSDGGDKSYEVEVGNDGKWDFKVNRRVVNSGASTAIKTGNSVNKYTMICKGNEVSFLFNGVEPKGSRYVANDFVLGAGNVGFVVTSLRAIPVNVEIESYQISEP